MRLLATLLVVLVAAACQNDGDGSLEEAPPDTVSTASDSGEEPLVVPTRSAEL